MEPPNALLLEEEEELTTVRCDQCCALMINGIFCHETGCPNSRKTYIPERDAWVLFLDCFTCGYPVEAGEVCDCQLNDGEGY